MEFFPFKSGQVGESIFINIKTNEGWKDFKLDNSCFLLLVAKYLCFGIYLYNDIEINYISITVFIK